MTVARWPPHPAELLRRFGVSEIPAGMAAAVLALLQYVFLAQMWRGYPFEAMGSGIHPVAVMVGLVLCVGGAVVSVAATLARVLRGRAAARRLERPANSDTFARIRSALERVAQRSTLAGVPLLLYTPKNANALEVRDLDKKSPASVVVGTGQRAREIEDAETFSAQLGHEVSHLELGQTRFESGARLVALLHFRVLAWSVAIFLLLLGFIHLDGIDPDRPLSAFRPVWDGRVYARMTYQLILLALSTMVLLVYSRYFVVRSEHMHDFRGSQLAGTDALALRAFARPTSMAAAVRDFVHLHPSAPSRRRVVSMRDFILLSAVLYPLIVAAAQPLSLLLMTGWRDVFGWSLPVWNTVLTAVTGLLLYLFLSADICRLALGVLLRPRLWLRLPVYALMAGLATQIPRFAMEFAFGWRKNLPFGVTLARIWDGVLTGGGKIILMVAGVLLVLAYLSAIRIAAVGEARPERHRRLFHIVGAATTIGAFCMVSLSTASFIFDVSAAVAAMLLCTSVYLAVAIRCAACGRRSARVLALMSGCSCGTDRLALLRHWTSMPYSKHL